MDRTWNVTLCESVGAQIDDAQARVGDVGSEPLRAHEDLGVS